MGKATGKPDKKQKGTKRNMMKQKIYQGNASLYNTCSHGARRLHVAPASLVSRSRMSCHAFIFSFPSRVKSY